MRWLARGGPRAGTRHEEVRYAARDICRSRSRSPVASPPLGLGGQQIEVPIPAAAGHQRITGTQTLSQLRQHARFVEPPVEPFAGEHIPPKTRTDKSTGRSSGNLRAPALFNSRSNSTASPAIARRVDLYGPWVVGQFASEALTPAHSRACRLSANARI